MGTIARLAEVIRERVHPLRDSSDLDPLLNPLLERVCYARCVLLGEASHGTTEYYSWRARIGECPLRENGFSFTAKEATGRAATR